MIPFHTSCYAKLRHFATIAQYGSEIISVSKPQSEVDMATVKTSADSPKPQSLFLAGLQTQTQQAVFSEHERYLSSLAACNHVLR